MKVPEAKLEETGHGLRPGGEGWFVLNTRDALWQEGSEFGRFTRWEGLEDARFKEIGINIGVMEPGQPACMYHAEDAQEDFLVLSGEAVLIVEGEERALKAWDFVHCPAWTRHVIVATGTQPCAVLAIGARNGRPGLVYPVDEAAGRHGASVSKETPDPDEAYAGTAENVPIRYRDGDLPA